MHLSKAELEGIMFKWAEAWNRHDLHEVMELFHDEAVFENWTGSRVRGKEALRKAWTPWFENHGNFTFISEEMIIDEEAQKVIWRWYLEWPSFESGYTGKPERRRGLDVMRLKDGKIIDKSTYSKTTVEIDKQKVRLTAHS